MRSLEKNAAAGQRWQYGINPMDGQAAQQCKPGNTATVGGTLQSSKQQCQRQAGGAASSTAPAAIIAARPVVIPAKRRGRQGGQDFASALPAQHCHTRRARAGGPHCPSALLMLPNRFATNGTPSARESRKLMAFKKM